MRRRKVHAVVARSTFPSPNVKNTTCSGHFEKLKCRQNARVAGARDCAPCKGFVAISPKTISTPLQLQPPHHTTLHSTTHHYTTLHYTTLRYTTLHYTTLHYATLHYVTLHYTTTTTTGTATATTAPTTTTTAITLHHTTVH